MQNVRGYGRFFSTPSGTLFASIDYSNSPTGFRKYGSNLSSHPTRDHPFALLRANEPEKIGLRVKTKSYSGAESNYNLGSSSNKLAKDLNLLSPANTTTVWHSETNVND